MSDGAKNQPEFAREVGATADRKIRARKNAGHGVWFGLGMMGLVGWSVVVPTLLGAAIGHWLDKRQDGSHSWTLTLLIIGLALGCLNSWRWVAKESEEMREDYE